MLSFSLLVAAATTVILAPTRVAALDNGLGLVPPLGYSSWNDCSSNVTETHMKQIVAKLMSSGLAAKGYIHINVDEGWLKSRNASGWIVEDFEKFPSGMKGFGDWVHSQEYAPGKHLKYGLYTSRGTCQCSTQWYHGPGSNGYEMNDALFMAQAGADYIKEDSCCGSQVHETAFEDYARMRDALNKTGRSIYFSLCGWNTWYAPVGYSLGNSWRISGDGSGWDKLTICLNKMAHLTEYNGPGGWNDPDLLIGPNVKVGGQTDQQARAQFTMWAIFPAPIIVSNNLLEASDYFFETLGNEEILAIHQDVLGRAGFRAVGEDLPFPCSSAGDQGMLVQVQPCRDDDHTQQWTVVGDKIALSSNTSMVLDDWQCAQDDGSPIRVFPDDKGTGTCDGKNQQWAFYPDGTVTSKLSGKCLDVYEFTGPQVDVWECNGGKNQAWTQTTQGQLKSNQTGMCLTAVAQSCSNVWLRLLSDGSWAMAFLNNDSQNATITCDASCFAQTSLGVAQSVVVRDLWQHRNVTTLDPSKGLSFSDTVPGNGFAFMYRLYPAW